MPSVVPGGRLNTPHSGRGGRVEVDLYGPIKCNDRNGNEYLFGGICDSTGASFIQPLRAKSGAAKALRSLHKWIEGLRDVAEVVLNAPRGDLKAG